jgi:hypothetical protein
MRSNATTPTDLLTALALAREHGDVETALRGTGLDLDDLERFFTSCGHAYRVEAVPVRGDEGSVVAVLAIAVAAQPPAGRLRRAAEFERAADALEDSARQAEDRADRYRVAGQAEAEQREREAAEQARRAARRARAHGFRQRSNGPRHGSE